jgi:hypothetical protein
MFALDLQVKDGLTRPMKTVVGAMKNPVPLYAAMGAAIVNLTRDWVAELAKLKHDTASELGAKRTGFYARAVDAIRSYEDTTGVSLIIDHPGFANARKDVEIERKNAAFLTIPTHRLSYGKRAGEFDRSKTFVRKSGKTKGLYIWYKPGNGKIIPLYRLVTKVTKREDNTLLPSDADYSTQARLAFAAYFREQMKGVS